MSAGYDNVDVPMLRARGIPVGHTPRVLDDAVADIAMALLLTASRRLQEGRRAMEQGGWLAGRPQWMLGRDVAGSTVGVVGLGGIGQAFARRARAFNIARLLYTGHRPKPEAQDLGAEFVSLDELLAQSDFVLCACPLNAETQNLFDARAFGKMKNTATFINVSRGGNCSRHAGSIANSTPLRGGQAEVGNLLDTADACRFAGCVDQDALLAALKSGQIWAAALDVMSPEPLPTDHPLLRQHNCVLFPHCGSATIETRNAMACRAAENILCGLEGKAMPSPIP
ncbi:glyoxylate reductase hydroxypyruvate reductase-like [Olea europaea subsp. europaea]|uniref:Glyoxylate reductase hydroxypyruvate reductase-like n=1 Tax=Olea europaea subsp. europaea TaxID=158383 RepID=A0A8S0VMG2_OLEEU|nr:glyoxylate reductase hydroxypyruvate reductase-like [Olea europaea subsp. europaea]